MIPMFVFSEKAQSVRQMLEALEAGQNQFITSLNPPKLRELKGQYKLPDSGNGPGRFQLIFYLIHHGYFLH